MNIQKEELKKKLNIQVIYAITLCVLFTIATVIFFATRDYTSINVTDENEWGGFSISGFQVNFTGPLWASITTGLLGVPSLVIWILGIINAVQIHKITKDGTLLIVFSVLPLWIGQIIVATSYRSTVTYRLSAQEQNNIKNENDEKNSDL